MARSIKEIKQEIIDAKNADLTLVGLNSISTTSIFGLWADIQAAAVWTLEKLFDIHLQEVKDTISTRAHTLKWYTEKAKQFQLGHALVEYEDYYDNSALTDADVETARIVKFASAYEESGQINIKVAKLDGESLTPLSNGDTDPQDNELAAFNAYINTVKDAGVKIEAQSNTADTLNLNVQIYYDPLVLSSDGKRLDGTNDTPLEDAINHYLSNLPFNGYFTRTALIDSIQNEQGFNSIYIIWTSSEPYGTQSTVSLDETYQPKSGYMTAGNIIANYKIMDE